MDSRHDIAVLNGLIETTLDSAQGFADAAEHDGTHAPFFASMAQERTAVASRLQLLVAGLGGTPVRHSSTAAAAHRGFMNLKQALLGRSEQAVVNEVERGEDYIKGKYQTALEDKKLSQETLQVIVQAYESVRQGHDRASALKHSLAAKP